MTAPVVTMRCVLARMRVLAARPEPAPARSLRPVLVPASLSDLHGPAAGIVELPVRLYWSAGSRRFDLGDPDEAAALYDAVLSAATGLADITEFMDAGLLVRAWPVLSMSRATREAWEQRFPVLYRRRRPAAA